MTIKIPYQSYHALRRSKIEFSTVVTADTEEKTFLVPCEGNPLLFLSAKAEGGNADVVISEGAFSQIDANEYDPLTTLEPRDATPAEVFRKDIAGGVVKVHVDPDLNATVTLRIHMS